MKQLIIQPRLIRLEKLVKARFMMRGDQPHPGDSHCLVIDVSGSVTIGESLDRRSDKQLRVRETHSVQRQPRKPKVITMTEPGRLQSSGLERQKKLVIAEVGGRDSKRHSAHCVTRSSGVLSCSQLPSGQG